MKRTLFLLFVLIAFPNVASTQECKVGFGQKFFKPASVALELVALACGYTIEYPTANDVPNQIVNLDGKEFTDADLAVTGILSNVPYRHQINTTDKIITVHRVPSHGTIPESNTSTPSPNTTRREFGRERSPAELNAYFAQQWAEMPPTHSTFGAEYRGLFYNPNSLRSHYYGFFDYDYQQRTIDASTWGALRFKKGREAFMENVEVYGCNQRLAQADEGNNIWDKKVYVPINCRPLTFRYSDGINDWEVEIDEMIIPLRLQSVKNITLDQGFFARARKRTKHLMYDMIEQPDGSFQKVPR